MEPSTAADHRLASREALRRLMKDALSRCGAASARSDEHEFYLGVEAAAHDALDPQRASTKPVDWIDFETATFREGYEQTAILIANAMSVGPMPYAFVVPEFLPRAT